MTHYHEVYFNEHTNDGPRVGATRRSKAEILRERRTGTGRYQHPAAAAVRCDRADDQCPWTVDGVPGTSSCVSEVGSSPSPFQRWMVRSNLETIRATSVTAGEQVALLRANGYLQVADAVEAAIRAAVRRTR